MSVAPVIPVVIGTNLARCLPWASFSTTYTPCTGVVFALDEVEAASTLPLFAGLGGVYIVRAWMGSDSTLDFEAVVIFAVVERPGRISSVGVSSVTITLKSFASSVPVVDWEVAMPVERNRA